MKSLTQAATILSVLIILGAGWYFYFQKTPAVTGNDIVGPAHIAAKLEGSATAIGVTVTPHEIIEDSRCPVDANCIWAGTLKVRATLSSDFGTGDQVFELGTPITTTGQSVMLETVTPDKHAGVTLAPSDYTFYFVVTRR